MAKSNIIWAWDPIQQAAFKILKDPINTVLVLISPYTSALFCIEADSSYFVTRKVPF